MLGFFYLYYYYFLVYLTIYSTGVNCFWLYETNIEEFVLILFVLNLRESVCDCKEVNLIKLNQNEIIIIISLY